MPLIIAISVVAGILIGTFYARHFAGNKLGIINSSSNKLNALLRVIDDQYVDTVNMTDLVEKAMPQILAGVISSSAQGLRQEWICRSTNIAYASVSAGSPPFSMRAQRA